jgi:hypothetical protein
MTTSIINATMMQVSNLNIDASFNILNYTQNTAVNFITLPFDDNFVSLIPRYLHTCNPEYLVFNLFNTELNLDTIKNLSSTMYLSLKYSNREIINIPISLLWSLNSPEIMNNKLYLFIPLNMFFGDISLLGLNTHCNITVHIHNISLQNYVSSYSLLCKIKMYADNISSHYRDMSDNYIQTVDCITTNNDFQLQYQINNINENPGIIKGFFIESVNIYNQLSQLQIYIDSNLNRSYDQFLLKTKTTRINDNLIYFPFNPENTYNERNYNSCIGCLSLTNNDSCHLNLMFNVPTNCVKIYILKVDLMRRSNYYIPNLTSYGFTGPSSYIYAGNNRTTGNYMTTSEYGHTSASNYETSNTTIPVGQTIYYRIDPQRNTCNILHEEIIEDQRYMMCTACNANFNETAIKQWLQHRTGTRRTCPTCREVWTNYNIYINSSVTLS